MAVRTLRAFTGTELARAKVLLAAQVASMMGRKLEEGDWNTVYCRAKGFPEEGWSNLYIDVNYNGIGVEMKLLRARGSGNGTLKNVCGQTLMHPSATRSIRIRNTGGAAQEVMNEVFEQLWCIDPSAHRACLGQDAERRGGRHANRLVDLGEESGRVSLFRRADACAGTRQVLRGMARKHWPGSEKTQPESVDI